MLNKTFITILVLISKNAFTLECGLDWSNSEALSVSLTDKGKNLEKFKNQDQNGFGTCYGNALSAVIFAKTQEPVSYHQIALAYATDPDQLKKRKIKTSPEKTQYKSVDKNGTKLNQNPLDIGGNACISFEALIKEDIICSSNASPIEAWNDPTDTKRDLYQFISSVYDSGAINTFRKLTPDEREKISKEIRKSTSYPKRLENKYKCFQKSQNFLSKENTDDTLLSEEQENTVEFEINKTSSKLFKKIIKLSKKRKKNVKKIKKLLNQYFKINKSITILQNDDLKEVSSPEDFLQKITSTKNIDFNLTHHQPDINFLKKIYAHIANEYNTYHKSRLMGKAMDYISFLNTEDSFRNLNADMSTVISNINNDPELKIEGVNNTIDFLFSANSQHLNLEDRLRESIHNLIPGECYQNYFGNIFDRKCNIYEISAYEQVNKWLNLFNREEKKGEWNNISHKHNYDPFNVADILLNSDKNYTELLKAITLPKCDKKENQIDKSKIDKLKCKTLKGLTQRDAIKSYIEKIKGDTTLLRKFCKKFTETAKKKECELKLSKKNFDQVYHDQVIDVLFESIDQTSPNFKGVRKFVNYLYLTDTNKQRKNAIKTLEYQKRFNNYLQNDTPMVLHVCSAPFTSVKDPKCEKADHAITLSGVKCENGKQKYQIINSWGKGPEWIDADVLFQRTFSTEHLSNY